MKRLFLAIPIKTRDNDFVPLLDGLKRQLAHEQKINWVRPDHIHLTLKFIGNTPDDDIPKIIEEVGEMLKRHKNFTMDFNRTGIFGSRYAPRVLWLGMQNTPQELLDLEEDTLTSFDKLGYMRDRQNFVPHITLGRIRELCEKQYFQKIVSGIEQKTYIKQEVNEIILYQSFLRPEGAMYKVIKKFKI
ncbi:MAG: RNA 2',3'-cyclic phosphodiesterase [Bacteroidales bacterium]|nr:RNA 2',3'-cyclic phosphodiesterase [Bacteroidales bacterium]MBR5781820.1 RNA 2',3'-cyclic phosphodiesterase [Bacteroidales bacterium]